MFCVLRKTHWLHSYGTQDYHVVRLRTTAKIIAQPALYNTCSKTFVLRSHPVLTPDYSQLIHSTLTNGSYAELIHVIAFSHAMSVSIQSYCCPDFGLDPHPYTLHSEQSRLSFGTHSESNVMLMWTTISQANEPNHFVLLVPRLWAYGLPSTSGDDTTAEMRDPVPVPNTVQAVGFEF